MYSIYIVVNYIIVWFLKNILYYTYKIQFNWEFFKTFWLSALYSYSGLSARNLKYDKFVVEIDDTATSAYHCVSFDLNYISSSE